MRRVLGDLAIILAAGCIFPFWCVWWLVKNTAIWLHLIWCVIGELTSERPAAPSAVDKIEADYLTTKRRMNDAAGKSYRNMVV